MNRQWSLMVRRFNMTNISVFASGNGTNFEKIMNYIEVGYFKNIHVTSVVTDKADAGVIERAKKYDVPVHIISPKDFRNKRQYEVHILTIMRKEQVEWIVLAGYMRLITSVLLNAFDRKILNVHPSLLPSFPGKDAIGQALDYGVKVTGATVHYVDSGMDTGEIIAQSSCVIHDDDTKDTLQLRVQNLEYEIYPQTIKRLIDQ